jgi:DNA-binding beta-propeller fold protein YncE
MQTQVVGERVYDWSHAVGRRDLGLVVGVAVSLVDTVYVVGRPKEVFPEGVPEVNRLTIGTTPGDEEFVARFGKYGDGDGQYIWPAGIALDSRENVYITDEWLHRVVVFDGYGEYLRSWGAAGVGDGEFNRPAGIAIDSDDNVFIVDSLNHRVQKLTRDGEFLAQWGTYGDGDGELDTPWGITVDLQGNVYVADHKNHRVQEFAADGSYLASFGVYGSGRGELNRPADVAVDPEGDVYVCDWANNRVQIFAPDGTFVTSLIGDAQTLSKWQQETVDANADVIKARRRVYTLEPEWRFAMPTGLAFDAGKSRLLVADTQRSRVQIYNKLKDYVEPQFNL